MNKNFIGFKDFYEGKHLILENETVLLEFEKAFPSEVVRGDPKERPFDFSSNNMQNVFDILNRVVFDSKLNNTTLYSLNSVEICELLANEYDTHEDPEQMEHHMAFHILWPYEGTGNDRFRYVKTDKEAIVFNNSFGRCSFGYAAATLCHEMIHMYDYIFGDALKRGYAKNTYHIDFDEHLSQVFRQFMKKAREEYDIPVIVDGNGHSYFELNEEAQKYFLSLKEESVILSENEKTKNGSPSIHNKKDGSFVIMGFFDI